MFSAVGKDFDESLEIDNLIIVAKHSLNEFKIICFVRNRKQRSGNRPTVTVASRSLDHER